MTAAADGQGDRLTEAWLAHRWDMSGPTTCTCGWDAGDTDDWLNMLAAHAVERILRDRARPADEAHTLVERGRIYDRCSCGWYGQPHSTHAAAARPADEDGLRARLATTIGLLPDCDHPTSRGVCPDCIATAVLATHPEPATPTAEAGE